MPQKNSIFMRGLLWRIYHLKSFQSASRKTRKIREFLEIWLNEFGQFQRCSNLDIEKLIKIFEKCKNGIPKTAMITDDKGTTSYGFYIPLLCLERHETDPILFFEVLEIDQKIGWTSQGVQVYCIPYMVTPVL